MQGAANADVEASANCPDRYKTINEDDYIKQIFYVDETALYWKKMPSRTFTTREKRLMASKFQRTG